MFLNVLIEEDRVPIRVCRGEACWPRFGRNLGTRVDPSCFEPSLNNADVLPPGRRLSILIPPRIKGDGVSLKHALEQPDLGVAIVQDNPPLGAVAADLHKAELFIEGFGGSDVLDGQAD